MSADDLSSRIEQYLLNSRGWVGAAELCRVFVVNERAFRADGRRRGLCSNFAISGDRGFRHIGCATDEEFANAHTRMRRHAVSEFIHARDLKRERMRRVTDLRRPPFMVERATGQGLLLQIPDNTKLSHG